MAILVITSFLTASASACSWSDGDFEIRVEPCQAQDISPGSILDINVYVKNVKGGEDNARVKLIGNYNVNKGYFKDESGNIYKWPSSFMDNNVSWWWWGSKLAPETVMVRPGEEITLYLQIQVPASAEPGKYAYKIVLNDFPCESEIEICSIELIPEFSTIAVPVGITLLGGLYFFRKQ